MYAALVFSRSVKRRENSTDSQEIARKTEGFQISAVAFLFVKNPQIFDEGIKRILIQKKTLHLQGLFFWN